MQLILRQGRLVDPTQRLDKIADLGIEDGRVAEIAPGCAKRASGSGCARLIVVPGFIDMHVHLREPGREDAETIESGTNAAVQGGFTGVACGANTQPVNDSEAVTSFILERAREVSKIPVYPIGAITKGSQEKRWLRSARCAGRESWRSAMMAGPCRTIRSCAGRGIFDPVRPARHRPLRRPRPAAGGCMNEGYYSTLLGLRGINPAAEEIHVARDAILARQTKARVHIAHLSTRQSLEVVKRAKKEKIALTCEVTPHHLLLTDAQVASYDTNMKMNPPLRTAEDVEALVDGLASGAIDVLATDHAPHNINDKMLEFDRAPFGVVGLETAISLMMDRLVKPGKISLRRLVLAFSTNPARILKLDRGTLAPGSWADVTVIDPELRCQVKGTDFSSRSRNTLSKVGR